MAKGRRRVDSSAQRAAAARSLLKARRAHGKGNLTSRQLAARRNNLAIARHDHPAGALTGPELAHARAAIAVAHAKAKTDPSAAQAAVQTKWAAAGEAAWLRGEIAWKERGRAAWLRGAMQHRLQSRVMHVHSLRATRRAPLGSRYIRGSLTHTLKPPRLLGEPRRFARAITPTPRGAATKWESARTHHFRPRVAMRRRGRTQIDYWRRNKRRVYSR